MKRIAVVGATGAVGIRLIDHLYSCCQIVAIVRDRAKRDFSPYPRVEIHEVADISDTRGLAQAFAGCVGIINTGYIWFAEYLHQAITMSRATIAHAVFTGSTGIHTSLPSPSAERKREAERFIQEHYRCPWTVIRPTMIYGHKDDRNISRLVSALNRFPVMPLIGQGNSLIQPVLVHDLVKAYGAALFNPRCYNKSYDIGGSKAYSNRELIACTAASMGRSARLVPLPAGLVRHAVALMSMCGISPISREQVERFQENKDIDLRAFIDDFHYVPRDFEHGIQFLLRDLREHGLLR